MESSVVALQTRPDALISFTCSTGQVAAALTDPGMAPPRRSVGWGSVSRTTHHAVILLPVRQKAIPLGLARPSWAARPSWPVLVISASEVATGGTWAAPSAGGTAVDWAESELDPVIAGAGVGPDTSGIA